MDQPSPTTTQTSSDGSVTLSTPVNEGIEGGSECGWRERGEDQTNRPMFYMGDEELVRFSTGSGYHRNVEGQTIRVGICAMEKKAKSKPMKEILTRLGRFEHLQLEVFEEDTIKKKPVSEWPVVDAFIAFFSTGFPLEKAIEYKNLNKPYVVNDLEAQYSLKDRREVYKILVREGIAHPRYSVLNRDEEEKGEFEENDDAIEVNGVSFQRPFVEKPVDAEDHNIYIYFPTSAGGGCQRLFRKIGSRSSMYYSMGQVRKSGSFIYEDFMPTDGTDVKVYTVGPDYAHAEARKSPALDGKVERDKDGKEVRFPVILSAEEKMIARKVCLAFKQNVCGFDLLRTGGKSYVCDVNGFSFVKNSTKYYDDCANVLGTMIVRALAPQLHIQNVALVLGAAPEDIPVVPTTSGSMMELRCVIAVIRHGDRTPKQKMKMEVKHMKFFELFKKYNGYKKGHLKLKKPKQLQEVLDIARDLLCESKADTNPEVLEKKAKLRQLKLVLEMYGHFSGINRKVQLKYQPNGAPKKSSSEEGVMSSDGDKYYSDHCTHEIPKEPSLVLILKWGGELTPAGKYQAEDLGKAFRTLYPGGQGEFETPGLGFLRLHSTFRHDLKIYASDEGRVQMTAAAFTKGLLALEGELPPILVSMVKSANTNGLLDKEGETSKYQHIVKEKLMEILNQDKEFDDEDAQKLAPTQTASLQAAMQFIKNPKKMNDLVHEMVHEITAKIKDLKRELKSRDLKLYHGESWELLIRRWAKLEKDFKLKTGMYDISKIPDIYDCIKYDLQHNQKTLQFARAEELFRVSKALADIVIPQEYGITVEEKLHISQSICTPLMRKLLNDLQSGCQGSDEESTRLNSKYSKGVSSPERFVRTRLYFTSESHIHSLLNMLRHGGLCDELNDEQWKKAMDFLSTTPELNYMTQINIMMFEDPSKDPASPEKYHVELHFSPGAYTSSDKNVVNPVSSGYRTSFLVRQGKKGKNKDTITEESLGEESFDTTPDTSKPEIGADKDGSPKSAEQDSKPVSDDSVILEEKTDTVSAERTETGVLDKIETNSKDSREEIADKSAKMVEAGQLDQKKETADPSNSEINTDTGITVKVNDKQVDVVQTRKFDVKTVDIASARDIGISSSDLEVKNLCEDAPKKVREDTEKKAFKVIASTSAKHRKFEGGKDLDSSTHDDVIFEPLFDDEEAKTITNEKDMEKQGKKVPKPLSPNPDIPEWDWDDPIGHPTPKTSQSHDTTLKSDGGGLKPQEAPHLTGARSDACVSKPISIDLSGKPATQSRSAGNTVSSYEETRSKSLEEKEKQSSLGCSNTLRPTYRYPYRYSLSDVFASFGDNEQITILEKHYCTIHLPIKDNYHSFSSLLYLNPEAFKEALPVVEESSDPAYQPRKVFRMISYSSPSLSEMHADWSARRAGSQHQNSHMTSAFDGFNMVPSLKPLETLHNNLTMRDLDAFLSRATTTKFFTPASSPMVGVTPLVSPRCPEFAKAKSISGPSLPSSCSSSAGPSSPTSASTPVDFMNKVKMFIDTSKPEQTDNDNAYSEQSQSSANQKSDPSQLTSSQPIKAVARPQPLAESSQVTSGTSPNTGSQQSSQTDSPRLSENCASASSNTTHQSAFKVVTRSNSQRNTMFYVSQVPEDSLKSSKGADAGSKNTSEAVDCKTTAPDKS
ncbi:inositol hexakisphosphate and diphosphoinositol-pentakisphosphate kinase 2-like isoform X5 [Mya arenaria]|uniref:inositol hexakisphosphate and diphosphoinositol-pentakisphosphate kinase 2-like isoform X5 n=1 Tax=Mya arenaria TaxID=6604 RepID=UPI0022E6C2DF|nr:inositol hexakisphosphate and diphosphoinositol-pentakisphosphate kinase 2-like isoform X5 [Mya arenaria]